MKYGVLGSGMVGQTIAARLAALGHEVMVGTRSPEKLADWQAGAGRGVQVGGVAEAAAFGELLFNATSGRASLEALQAAGEANLNGKTLVDIANPLDFSHGMPPTLFISNDDSLGESIQRAFPGVKVVKALNTVNASLMVDARLVANGEHTLFICGNDAGAKAQVIDLLRTQFGWQEIIDLGDISNARATEALLPIWVRLYGAFGTPMFQFKIVR